MALTGPRRQRRGLAVRDRELSGRHRQGERAARPDRQRRARDRRSDDGEVEPHRVSVLELEATGIVKRYGTLLANDHVDLAVARGEIHAVMGENGAGKSTLMSILYGLQQPDEGTIWLRGEEVHFRSALDAIAEGMGMVHQAFKLFNSLSVSENIVYGKEPQRAGFLDRRAAREKGERSLPSATSLFVDPGRCRRKALGRRAPARRDPEGALSRRPDPDPRRADCGADTAGARRPVRGDEAARRRRADHPFRHPQDPRGDGGHRSGDRAPRRTRGRADGDARDIRRARSCAR